LSEPLRDLTVDEFQAIVDQFPVLERVVLHGIGEPMLNDGLAPMIRYVKDRHPSAAVLFNSNAILLQTGWQGALIDAQLDELRVSLDAATRDTYARIRGIDAFGTVIENVRQFTTLSHRHHGPRVSFWLTAMRENLAELPGLVDLAADLGVPEVYVQRLVLTQRGLAQPEQSLYRRLRAREDAALTRAAERASTHGLAFRASGLASPQASLRGRNGTGKSAELSQTKPWSACYRLWTLTYITANGNVLPCCISPFSTTDYAELVLGNVFESPFAQIWNGAKYVARRAALYTTAPLHPCEMCGADWPL
jgi:MoaA/NifB/PqqE/SkfB family radical SAM enzyme